MRRIRYILLLGATVLFCCSCLGKSRTYRVAIDSLNNISFAYRFKDINISRQAAEDAYDIAQKNHESERMAEALNNLAHCAFMGEKLRQKDEEADKSEDLYGEAKRLYEEAEASSGNEIERLIADVGRMKIAQRLSQNKDFYYARNSALKRLRRIDEDKHLIDNKKLTQRLVYAESEFYMVAAIYHKSKQQQEAKFSAINSISPNYALSCDTAQWLSYELVTGSGGLYEAPSDKEVTLGEFGNLVNCILIGRSKGHLYLEASALLALSEMIGNVSGEHEYSPYELICEERVGVMELILREETIDKSEGFGLKGEGYDISARLLGRALELFDKYGDMYGVARTDYILGRFSNMSGLAEQAIAYLRDGLEIVVDNVPELEMEIREQLSVAYSAMGMKDESDYNRSVYIDLLEYTRQDREDNLRMADLERESKQLDIMIVAAGLFSVLLLIFIAVMSDRWRKRNEAYLSALEQDLTEKRDKTAEALENGTGIAALDEEMMRLKKERYIHKQHIADNKCQNIIKKACLSIVGGIVPYIDRIVNEINKLQTESYAQQEDVKRSKLAYISELAAKINEYNDILSLWIKMKQGSINLNIENFRLNDLFQIVAKGKHSFEMKGQTLEVTECDATVKADKALTLFMINTLAENARKYTGEGGTVKIYAKGASEHEGCPYVEVSVEDNGPGLSAEDISKILNEKVYDSGQIGMRSSADREVLRQKKGHGFGLMNCKGIIEKYRKTSPVFSVCSFSIESELGKGSRFFFRLPKGVVKAFVVLAAFMISCTAGGYTIRPYSVCGFETAVVGRPQGSPLQVDEDMEAREYVETRQDTLLLQQANEYANIVYECNLDSAYEEALVYADSAIVYLNKHFTNVTGKTEPLLQLYDSEGYAAEEEWIAMNFNSDYNILIYVRNEVAVAALALKDFALYEYNNSLHSFVYRYVTSYNSLEEYCQEMELASGRKLMIICILGLIVLVCAIVWYVIYYRHRLLYRYNVEQLFYIYNSILETASTNDENVEQRLAENLYSEINELIPVTGLALAVNDEETKRLRCYFSGKADDNDGVEESISQAFGEQKALWSKEAGGWSFIPLWTSVAGENKRCAGVLGLIVAQSGSQDEDLDLVEMVASYLSIVLYHTVIRVRRKFSDIELAQDEARRTSHEENMLHVQNMVLDNCLSTIKHETVYYPNRIKQIADSLIADDISESEKIQTMSDLVGYYKDVFTILSSCAARQLEEVTFRRGTVDVEDVITEAEKYFNRSTKKSRIRIELELCAEPGLKVSGDKVLIEFLLHNLIDDAIRFAESGRIALKARLDREFVRFEFIDSRRSLPKDQLDFLFSPDSSHIKVDESGRLIGAEYLVCKQIVRDHDEFAGKRGCRINAESSSEGGFVVWFTLRKV